MKEIDNPEQQEWSDLTRRPLTSNKELDVLVSQVFSEVKASGDQAVSKFTREFDGADFPETRVPQEELRAAGGQVSQELKQAIALARKNIERFHQSTAGDEPVVETAPGVECWREKRAIDKVGLYIPGGTAPLFSTILMLAIPARMAGCREIILCTPPGKDGLVHPVILYCAHLCGIDSVYRIGGIQAVAAMTFGTQSISQVYKIFGPGNQYVTAAKQMATKHGVAIDMPAGPSELLVLADDSAEASFIASDLLSQAEHGPDSQVVLISLSRGLLAQVKEQVELQLKQLPRMETARRSLEHSLMVFTDSPDKALELANAYAPEHCIIVTRDPEFFSQGIRNAGSVFLGNYSPESAGDYASGTNHTLPTNGYARQYSGVSVDSFTKTISFQRLSEEGIRNIGPAVELMAEAEGLQAHKNAISLRLQYLRNNRT